MSGAGGSAGARQGPFTCEATTQWHCVNYTTGEGCHCDPSSPKTPEDCESIFAFTCEGDTYATGTIREAEPATGAYAAWTYSRNENAAATEDKLRGVLREIHERGITEEERADAVGYLRGRRAFTVQTPGQVLDRILWDRSRELPPGERDRLVERAAALPLAEINEFAKRFYDPARFTMIRVETK